MTLRSLPTAQAMTLSGLLGCLQRKTVRPHDRVCMRYDRIQIHSQLLAMTLYRSGYDSDRTARISEVGYDSASQRL